MRIPIPDRPGAAAEMFTLAAELGVNIASFEVVHLAESNAVSPWCWSTPRPPSAIAPRSPKRGFRPAITPLT